MDLKYELMNHPAIHQTSDGGGPPYIRYQKKPKNWLPGAPLFTPEPEIKKEEPEHEQSEEE